LSNTKLQITEIPVGCYVSAYKNFLETKKYLKNVSNKTIDENSNIHFEVEFKQSEDLDAFITNGSIEKEFKLIKLISINNMHLFNAKLQLKKYNDPLDILKEYYSIRLDLYTKRREYLIKQFQSDLEKNMAKLRFIEEYITGVLDINRKPLADIETLLNVRKYPKFTDTDSISSYNYNYLTKLSISSLSLEKINDLQKICESTRKKLQEIQTCTANDLWYKELEHLENLL
jgi:DNA topoisomerase-2